MTLFKLRGKLSDTQNLILGFGGLLVLIIFWWVLAEGFSRFVKDEGDYNKTLPSSIVPDSTQKSLNRDSLLRVDSIHLANAPFRKVYPNIPPPAHVVQAYPKLIRKDRLFQNTIRSVWLNIRGYFWAVFFSIPIGLLIGLFPLFRGLFSKPVDALRYLPLTALIGVFIIWFGIEDEMKIAFLAFGIIVYLLPVVVQRINEVNDVYLKTVFTLGATDWQTVKSVYFPSVLAKLMDDIRVLTAISWTYIIIVEYINKEGGGLGALIYIKRRLGQVPDMFAILVLIVLIGFLQDRIFVYLDRRLFPHKYYKTSLQGILEVKYGLFAILGITCLTIFQQLWLPAFNSSMSTITLITTLAGLVFMIYGEFKVQKSLRKSF